MKKREPAGEGRDRRRKIRPLAAFLLAAALAVTAVQLPGVAAKADTFNSTKTCTLTVEPGGQEYANDLDGKVDIDLYKVADAVDGPGNGYQYTVEPAYEEAFDGALDLKNLSSLTDGSWRDLARKAARVALDQAGNPALTPTMTGKAGKAMEQLTPGLYLIVARDANSRQGTAAGDTGNTQSSGTEGNAGNPEDTENAGDAGEGSEGGQEAAAITTQVQTDRYIYTFEPVLVSIPSKEPVKNAEGNEIISTGNPGDWQYNVTATLKPTQKMRRLPLTIVKNLTGQSVMSEPATFVFQVDAWMDTDNDDEEENVYSNVAGITLDGETSGSVTLADAIPVGARVVVTEVYTGASYEVSGAGASVNLGPVSAEDDLQAEFTNTPTNRHRGGHGIVNSFTYNGNSWDLVQDPASAGTE